MNVTKRLICVSEIGEGRYAAFGVHCGRLERACSRAIEHSMLTRSSPESEQQLRL